MRSILLGGRRQPGRDSGTRGRPHLLEWLCVGHYRAHAAPPRYETFIGQHGQGSSGGLARHPVLVGEFMFTRKEIADHQPAGADLAAQQLSQLS